MTNEQALKIVKDFNFGKWSDNDLCIGFGKDCTEDDCPRCIDEALDKAVQALKRQTPRKPIYTNEGTVTRCPNCEAVHFRCLPSVEVDYCVRCGQAIDWSEVE